MEKIDFNKHFIASIDTKSTQKIKVTQDLKEFFKFIAYNPDAKEKDCFLGSIDQCLVLMWKNGILLKELKIKCFKINIPC